MLKPGRHLIYKKYKDELWGDLILSKKFSYNKKNVLFSYRDKILRNRIRLKIKFRYFRRGFLRLLRSNSFLFCFSRLKKRLANYLFLSQNSDFPTRRIFIKYGLKLFFYQRRRRFRKFRRNNFKTLLPKKKRFYNFWLQKKIIFRSASLRRFLPLNFNSLKKFSLYHSNFFYCLKGKRAFVSFKPYLNNKKNYFSSHFFKKNYFRYILQKKLKIKKGNSFFYSVHIASPNKKLKKWSLFGHKKIYYKKISTFYGFITLRFFFNFINKNTKNQTDLFSLLECRLEVILRYFNFFPSVYFIKKFISGGNVYVNNKLIISPSFCLKPGDIVSLNKSYLNKLYCLLLHKLEKRKVLNNHPAFIEIDYAIMCAIVIRFPNYKDVTRPPSFNLYTSFPSLVSNF